jgi:ribA/ribD-fused uncharacterized protein
MRTFKCATEDTRGTMAANTVEPPTEDPGWVQRILKRLEPLEHIQRSVSHMQSFSIPALEKGISNLNDRLDDVNKVRKEDSEKICELEGNMATIQGENTQLKTELSEIKSKLLYMESQCRRNNLIFKGIQEDDAESWDAVEAKVLQVLETDMEIANARNIVIERAHRINDRPRGKTEVPRSIVVKFLNYKDRQLVLSNTKKLADKRSEIMVFEDYPREVQTMRQKLWPIYKAAKQMDLFKKSVSMKVDKLVINGKPYTTNNLHELPTPLLPENRSVKSTDATVVFYSKHSLFSNFHAMNIRVEGVTYCCNEQYFQRCKALHFGDYETAQKIMDETDPHVILSLGKHVKGFRKDAWEKNAYRILKQANTMKYQQNPVARQTLLDTGTREIGEASPDMLYGTGIRLTSPIANDISKWKGKNWMGKILSEIRDVLDDS